MIKNFDCTNIDVPPADQQLTGQVYLHPVGTHRPRYPMGRFTMWPVKYGIAGEVYDLYGRLRGKYINSSIYFASYSVDGTFTGFEEVHIPFRLSASGGQIDYTTSMENGIGTYSGCAAGALAAFHCLELLRFCRDDVYGHCEVDMDKVQAYLAKYAEEMGEKA